MALENARALLDELMGRQRDITPSGKASETPEWRDSRVCRYFLVKFCPNQLFTNTKADMGPCHKLHDDFIKQSFHERASKKDKEQFEAEFIRFCQQMLSEVDRRIKRAKQRLAASQKNNANEFGGIPLSEELQEKMKVLSERIETLLSQIEELGCEGKVEEAQGIMKLVDKLKEEKATLKRDSMPLHWIQQRAEIGAAQEKQMEVCDVCGAFLIVNDVQQRVDDHLMGKQHVGFGMLKTALNDLLVSRRTAEKNEEEEEVNRDAETIKKRSSRVKDDSGEEGHSSDSSHRRSHHRTSYRNRSPDRTERHKTRRSRSRSKERRTSKSERSSNGSRRNRSSERKKSKRE